MTSARPKMRTMPSATLVTVPSLRASAARPTFSMRVLISSLIADGLSVVVAIASFLGARRPARGWIQVRASLWSVLLRQRGLQAFALALEPPVDDHFAGVDHRAADQALVDRGLELDLAAEALAQRRADRLQLGVRQRLRRSHRRLDHALGLVAQLLVQAGDLRQQRHAPVLGQHAQEALH